MFICHAIYGTIKDIQINVIINTKIIERLRMQ